MTTEGRRIEEGESAAPVLVCCVMNTLPALLCGLSMGGRDDVGDVMDNLCVCQCREITNELVSY